MVLKKVMDTVKSKATAVKDTAALVTAVAVCNYHNVLCEFSLDQSDKISVSGPPDSINTVFKKLVGVVAGISMLVGAFMVLSGIIKYLQAKGENNSAGESQAGWQMGIGLAFVGMPIILNAIFTG